MKNYSRLNTFEPPINERSYSLGQRSPAESLESLRSRRFQQIRGKIAGTLALCVFGTVLSIVGLYWFAINHKGYTPFLIIGLLCLVPGCYGAYEIVATMKGWPGFDQLPDTEQLLDELEDQGENWLTL